MTLSIKPRTFFGKVPGHVKSLTFVLWLPNGLAYVSGDFLLAAQSPTFSGAFLLAAKSPKFSRYPDRGLSESRTPHSPGDSGGHPPLLPFARLLVINLRGCFAHRAPATGFSGVLLVTRSP